MQIDSNVPINTVLCTTRINGLEHSMNFTYPNFAVVYFWSMLSVVHFHIHEKVQFQIVNLCTSSSENNLLVAR